MSFLKISLTRKNKNSYYRKENKDSHKAIHFPQIYYIKRERASAFASEGSITLEAAVVVPIFFFTMLCLAFLLEIMALTSGVRNAVYATGKELAKQAYDSPIITTKEMERQMSSHMGKDLEKVKNISCDGSVWNWSTGILELKVQYEIEIPFLFFEMNPVVKEESIRVKGWNGYAHAGLDSQGNQMVYMTEQGIVYHSKEDCTYLDMSVSSVRKEDVDEIRNSSGAKYYPCEKCGKETARGDVYVTTHGTRYHTSLECKKIKRTVYRVPITDVYGIGGCSKCVK